MSAFFIIFLFGSLIITTPTSPASVTRPSVKSIKLNNSYLYPPQMQEVKKDCLNSKTVEVAFGQQMLVTASSPFSVFFTAQIS
jgi:hypothetical protein